MGNAFINSLIVTIPSTVIPITIAAFAAYAFAWIPFRGRGILFTIVVALLVVPIQMSLIPILQIYSGREPVRLVPRHLAGAHGASACRSRSSCSTTSCRSCRATCSSPPRSMARPHFQTFIRIVLPLSIPALGAFAIFQFLWVWNDLLVALVFLGPGADVRVMPTALLQPDRQPRRLMAPAHRRRVPHDDRAAARVPAAPAGIRARDPGRLRQVVTLARLMIAFAGTRAAARRRRDGSTSRASPV